VKIRFLGPARRELRDAVAWYRSQSGDTLGSRFSLCVQASCALLSANPGLGTPGRRGTRAWPLRDFPFTLVYRSDAGAGIVVVAVAHQSRQPGYWLGRV
jgi:plasmid stabilization system protein ParE